MTGVTQPSAMSLTARARTRLGRTGASLSTDAVLQFALDHARARDAVHAPFEAQALAARLTPICGSSLIVQSAAPDRTTYLTRPDLGARLPEAEHQRLAAAGADHDLAILLGDGLSPKALEHAPDLLGRLWPALIETRGLSLAPPVIATGARVALGDGVGEALGARMVLVLIGERPGLSAADSLGAYLTWSPRSGRVDSERNCVSNIRPAGLPPDRAAHALLWLIDEARRRRLTGVALKDLSGLAGVGQSGQSDGALLGTSAP